MLGSVQLCSLFAFRITLAFTGCGRSEIRGEPTISASLSLLRVG